MEMEIALTGGKKVAALYRGFTIQTDQPELAGGANTAPTPFDLFIASIGTCAGIYVVGFCEQRGIPYEDIKIYLKAVRNEATRMIGAISIDIKLPPDFPMKYADAVVKAAQLCAVKKHLIDPPTIEIFTSRQ